MSTLQILADVFAAPTRGLAAAANRRSVLPPLAAATVASLLFAALLVPRLDLDRTIADRLEKAREAEATAQMTPHQREEAIAQGAKVAQIGLYARGAFGPAGMALGAAFCLFAAFRVAGAKPAFVPTLAVVGGGQLPQFLPTLLTMPALLGQSGMTADESGRLLPTSPAAFLAAEAQGVHVGLLSALDVFDLWALGLLVIGMAQVAGVSRARAAAVTTVLWLSWVALSSALQSRFGT
jgi:hypothetical protein